MKIVFLCGSLEPGRDGVGDYTLRLAGEMTRQGNEVGIIALYDRHIDKDFTGLHTSGNYQIPVLRLNFQTNAIQRYQVAGSWIDDFDPEWLSIQYVPFSFHPKGMSTGLGKALYAIGKKRNWHIMFHELWVGMHIGASLKETLWGKFQRQLIRSMIGNIKPGLIHTQSGLYKAQLKRMGFEAQLLPLFSNIPVAENKDESVDERKGTLQKGRKIYFVLFGGVHKGGPVIQFAEEIKTWSDRTGIPVLLLIAGRGGNEQKYWEKTWEQAGLEVEIMGELPELELSKVLSRADFGITTTVLGKVEKSGSVAAMKDHGLKVICVAAAWQSRGTYTEIKIPGVVEYVKGGLDKFFQAGNETGPFLKVEEVSGQLIDAFSAKHSN